MNQSMNIRFGQGKEYALAGHALAARSDLYGAQISQG